MKRRKFIAAVPAGLILYAENIKISNADEPEKISKTDQSKEPHDFCPKKHAQGEKTFSKSTRSVLEPARRITIAAESDVVVCGGGPAGIAAALAAARSGVKTTLIESENCLGGIWTAGALCLILDQHGKQGIMREILLQLEKMKAIRGNVYDVEIMKYLLDKLCSEAKIDLRLHTRVAAAQTAERKIQSVIIESKSGREAISGKIFIDCTGDGDLAAMAGCGYDFGNPQDGSFQPMSLMALLAGINKEALPFTDHQKLLAELARANFVPSYRRPSLWYLNGTVWGLMATHLHGFKGTRARDLTDATIKARSELHQLVDSLRSLGGVWKDLWLVSTAQHIGVREGRRIHGRYTVSEQDVLEGKKQVDAVCRVSYPIDLHRSTPARKGEGSLARFVKSKPYDIPMRALIAKDLDNLLMAGRCISGDFIAHASYRVTGNAVPMGEAAGKKAAELVPRFS